MFRRSTNDQFALRELLVLITSFGVSFGLLAGGLAFQSPFFLFCALILFGATFGAASGFMFGGRKGLILGAAIGMLCLFAVYAASLPSFD